MKKMYKQPIVEATELIAGGQALCTSPGNLQNSGEGTDNLGGGDIIGG